MVSVYVVVVFVGEALFRMLMAARWSMTDCLYTWGIPRILLEGTIVILIMWYIIVIINIIISMCIIIRCIIICVNC